jgi:hypothetical protein
MLIIMFLKNINTLYVGSSIQKTTYIVIFVIFFKFYSKLLYINNYVNLC